jgi:hypothetical protein
MDILAIQYFVLAYFLVSMVLGGIVAHIRGDFVTRGVSICLFSGLFGVAFMYLASSSTARQGDKAIWPDKAPEATVLNLIFFGLVFFVYRLISG